MHLTIIIILDSLLMYYNRISLYSEICLSQTLNKPEFYMNRIINEVST